MIPFEAREFHILLFFYGGVPYFDYPPAELIRALDNEGGELEMRVFERGAGVTLACGTGAVASAAVAHHWGLSGPKVTVVMPGGSAQVTLGDDVTLAGPVVAIAAIDWPSPV